MRTKILFLALCLPFSGLLRFAAYAEKIPFTSYHQSIQLRIDGKEYNCPTQIQIRFVPDGHLFKTDFSIDSDLRSVYTNLKNILTGVKKNKDGDFIRLYDIARNFDGRRIIVRNKVDYKRNLIRNLELKQTVKSVVALSPGYSDGVLRLDYEILDAEFDGVAGNLGLDAKGLVKLVFELLPTNGMEYRLPQEYQELQIKLTTFSFVPRNGNFYGLKAVGSARLTPNQFNDLMKKLSEKAS